ncbi:hypothetical protein AMS68_008029 [Peltaster fructicola]|uniref:Uncharacterized protein n=1 Tax=Peltaster fructicola TaxID=286661 RepID=A0A6H0Y632_9PEZI|nr:hypothetical protein AMS68_008029 [Peltaster fructicola]
MTGRQGPAVRSAPSNLHKSWHLSHRQHNQSDDSISVLFLQRLSESAIEKAKAKLSDCDTSDVPPPLAITSYPWIRDEPMSANGVCTFLDNIHDMNGHFNVAVAILVETEDDDCIVVASQGHNDQQQRLAAPIVTAVRVNLQAARPLATKVLMGGSLEGLVSDYEPLDLAKDYPPNEHLPKSRELVFEGSLKLSGKNQLTVVSLVHLGDKLESWKSKFSDANVNVTIVDNNANPPSRAELYQIFEALEKENTADDRIGYIFFIDNILDDQIIAVSRTGVYANTTRPSSISVLPVEDLVKLWNAVITGSDEERATENRMVENDVQQECGDIMRRERIYNPRVFDEENNDAALTVWFLQDFTHEEERQIRDMLAESSAGADDMGAEYAYMGYHADSIEALLEMFQRGDIYSPSYDPQAIMRFHEYPHHFFAIDKRIFSEGKIILGSSLDFWHPTQKLGWFVGTMPAADAQTCYINLDIANMGLEEFAPDAKRMWLSDLKAYSKEYDAEMRGETPE